MPQIMSSGIAWTPMKKSTTQSRTRSTNIYPPEQAAYGAAGADAAHDLAQLVWKHFPDEIGEALREAQRAVAPAKSQSTRAKSQKR